MKNNDLHTSESFSNTFLSSFNIALTSNFLQTDSLNETVNLSVKKNRYLCSLVDNSIRNTETPGFSKKFSSSQIKNYLLFHKNLDFWHKICFSVPYTSTEISKIKEQNTGALFRSLM